MACTCTKFADILQVEQGNEHVVSGIRIIFEVNARGNGSIVMLCDTFPLTNVTTQDMLSDFLNFMKSVILTGAAI
jgi:hypothetical protein